jgi:hypothetical protein
MREPSCFKAASASGSETDTELFLNSLKKLAKENGWENQLPEEIRSEFPFHWGQVGAGQVSFGQDHVILVALRGEESIIPGEACWIFLLLDKKGRCLDQIVCTISNRLVGRDGEKFCAFAHEKPLPDGARLVVRLDELSMRGPGHCIKHNGLYTSFDWGDDDLPKGEPTKWNIKGLMRITVKDRKFQVLFPTEKDNTERPR